MTDFHDRRDGRIKSPHVIAREQAQRAKEAAPFKLVQKGKGMVHIDGIGSQGNYGVHAGEDIGRGQVEYQAQNHCGGLTRIGVFRYVPSGHTDLAEALKAQQAGYHGKPCATCAAAAQVELGR